VRDRLSTPSRPIDSADPGNPSYYQFATTLQGLKFGCKRLLSAINEVAADEAAAARRDCSPVPRRLEKAPDAGRPLPRPRRGQDFKLREPTLQQLSIGNPQSKIVNPVARHCY
jgi:hypothetical protein